MDLLCDLNEVPTRVVEDCSDYRAKIGGLLREPHAERFEPFVFFGDVTHCERGAGNKGAKRVSLYGTKKLA